MIMIETSVDKLLSMLTRGCSQSRNFICRSFRPIVSLLRRVHAHMHSLLCSNASLCNKLCPTHFQIQFNSWQMTFVSSFYDFFLFMSSLSCCCDEKTWSDVTAVVWRRNREIKINNPTFYNFSTTHSLASIVRRISP